VIPAFFHSIILDVMLPTPTRDVIFKELSEGGVLFHTADEVYFGLNEVGRQVWKLLPPACESFEDLCTEVQRQYPTESMETIREDVRELLDDLIRFGLLSSASASVDSEQGAAPVPTP
jgi:hypothetical protein